jgi:hypothetical protein
LIKAIVSDESLGFFERPLDVCFQNTRKSSRCQRKIVVFLNKEECLFPSPNHPGQEHQKKPVRLLVDWAVYVSPENDQLVSQQRVFRKEFGFSSGQIGACAKHKRGRRWFKPTQKTFLKRMKAETDTLFDGGEYTARIEPLLHENGRVGRRVQAEWTLLIVLVSHKLRQGSLFHRAQHADSRRDVPSSQHRLSSPKFSSAVLYEVETDLKPASGGKTRGMCVP